MMKISVCGKGGSGKSSIVTLLANLARDRGYAVLVVDSDESNSGLYRMLGFDTPPVPLMELVGGKKSILRQMKSAPPLSDSAQPLNVLARPQVSTADIPYPHILARDGISLVCIGKILQSLEGCACPMGVLSREFLSRLRLKDDELAIVDMEAGVEHFGRGVDTSIDEVLTVVEPSLESVTLAERVNSLAAGSGVGRSWAVLNKVTSPEMESKLKEDLARRGITVIGAIPYDLELFQAGFEGRPPDMAKTPAPTGQVLDSLLLSAGDKHHLLKHGRAGPE
jgi:CO dehydrogenase maturation factor